MGVFLFKIEIMGKKLAILGFGLEGKSILKFLRHAPKYRNSKIEILDRKTDKNYLRNLERFDIIFRSPGVPYNLREIQQAVKNSIEFSSATKLFFDHCPTKNIVGITGTKGKGTTSTLLYNIFKTAGKKVYLAGNIGKPAIDILDKITKDTWVILELSSFQLQDFKKSPPIAAVVETFPDHLDAHKNIHEYLEAKKNICKYQNKRGVVFYFSGNRYGESIAKSGAGGKIAIKAPNNLRKNFVMARTIAKHLGVSDEDIEKSLANFKGIKHRLELVKNKSQIYFYNDSASTNPQTTAAAIATLSSKPRAHFIGVGGIGMSALARYYLSEGWSVSGSDLVGSQITDELKNEGVEVSIGKHRSSNMSPQTNLVIYNQAIPSDNAELVTAKSLGIAVKSYPEELGELTKKYKTIAIAGSHGKSTTTAMTSLILMEAGLDPTVIIGTKLKEFSPNVIARSRMRRGNLFPTGSPRSARDDRAAVNFRKGLSPLLVIEADEYKASFLNYHPEIAAITNIDKEHLDFYKNFGNVRKAFRQFKKQSKIIIGHERNPKILAKIKSVLKIPGKHNLENAALAYAIGRKLKVPEKTILQSLAKYRGAWRRMEYRGKLAGIDVYDDYAHHPTEIKATLAGFKENWPRRPLICVFQAHQAERLKLLFNDFKTAFADADKVIILPTYEVAGREKRHDNELSKKLAKSIGATYLNKPKMLRKVILSLIRSSKFNPPAGGQNSTLVMMGAGNINEYTNLLINDKNTVRSPRGVYPVGTRKVSFGARDDRTPIILICGGKNKNLNYSPLAQTLKKYQNVKQIILFGENKKKIHNEFRFINKRLKIRYAIDLKSAVRVAYNYAKKLTANGQQRTTILFSPGAASFDMFENYRERGRIFKNIVKSIKNW